MHTYALMEIKRRMRTRFTWMVAVLALVAVGFLMACSTKYSSSSNGLVIVPTQGSAVMETFSLNLANGQMSQINNVSGPPTPGLSGAVILDPAGAFAYVIMQQNAALNPSVTGITSFAVGSNGKLAAGTTQTLKPTSPTVNVPCFTSGGQELITPVSVQPTPVVPGSNLSGSMAIDSAGKYLFVADIATTGQTLPYVDPCTDTTVTSTVPVPGTVSVFAVSSGTLTEVPGSPFPLPAESGNGTPSASALAVTPTVYPVQYSYCSGHTPPATENLYVTDSVNYVLLNYSVDLSTGALGPPLNSTTVQSVPTGSVPSGVAVDPCNRFVYVANAGPGSSPNNVSAYTICSTINVISVPPCTAPDFSLHPITGTTFITGDAPGPIAVDAYGNFLYVVNTGSGNVSGYRINAATGSLTAFTGAPAAAGVGANSIAIRSDDSWVFVANFNSGTLSQYSISFTSGVLSPVGPVSTLDYPSGVAVK